MAPATRRYDLDWLRVIAFTLLMFFHTGMMFTSWDWHVKNLETSPGLQFIMKFLHEWRMPLLFFISGSAVWFLLQRLSGWQFFLNRQKRLLLPLMFGIYVIIPPQIYYERLYHLQSFSSFLDFYRTVFTSGSYPEGNLSWHHLWYVPYIWAYALVTLPLLTLARSAKGRPWVDRLGSGLARPWALFLLFLPGALAEILLRPYYPGDFNNLLSDWANFTHKLTFFLAGFFLAPSTRVSDVIATHRLKFLAAGFVSFLVLQAVWTGRLHPGPVAYRLMSNFNIWMWLLAALGFGRHYLSFNHPALKYANEAVYPFYILHQTIIVILGYHLFPLNLVIPGKFLVLLTGTFAITWVLYEFVVKPWNVLRVLFGMKARKTDPTLSDVSQTEGTLALRELRAWCAARRVPLGATILMAFIGALSWALFSSSSPRVLSYVLDAPSLATNVFGVPARQRVAVCLPPGYERSQRRYPVIYFLPNFNTHLWSYTGGAYQGYRLRADQDVIIVIPNTAHFAGTGCYQDSPLAGNWATFICEDVVRFVDANFRTLATPGARGLAGHGVGGAGALDLGLKRPDLFGAVYAMSAPLFDAKGLEDFGVLSEPQLSRWQEHLREWQPLEDFYKRRAFRDFMHTGLNSYSPRLHFETLHVSYGAAVLPDLSLPFPHIGFPAPSSSVLTNPVIRSRFEQAFGNWPAKLAGYARGERRLAAITIEYGKNNDEYQWIQRGATFVAGLMKSTGVPCELVASPGGHESTLGQRLELGMLPTLARQLQQSE